MAGAHPHPFQGGMVGSGMVFVPPIITSTPSTRLTGPGHSGPFSTTHTVVGPLPTSGGPTLATMVPTIPPFMQGGSGPSVKIIYAKLYY